MIKQWNDLELILPRQNDAYTFKEVLGEFNQYCFEEWMHLMKNDDMVIDLGAHIGLFSLAISRNVGQVLALESNEENYCYLIDNISHNHIENITPIKKAISINNGEASLNVSALSPARHSFYLNEFFNKNGMARFVQNIETVSLSSLFETYAIKFCKLIKSDIEGAEYEVFLNCPQEIIQKVGIFLIEYHEDASLQGKNELAKYFSNNGFQIHFGDSINYGGLTGGSLRVYNKALFK